MTIDGSAREAVCATRIEQNKLARFIAVAAKWENRGRGRAHARRKHGGRVAYILTVAPLGV